LSIHRRLPTPNLYSVPTRRSSDLQSGMLIQGSPGDFHAYMAAKEIPDPLALTQPGDHAVEPGLEKPDLSSVIDGHLHLELAVLRSEEHTSELQSPDHLVCRLLLEK